MSKYDIRICKCGRIHAIPDEKIENALGQDKNLVLICGGCGRVSVIGADKEPDSSVESHYKICTFDIDENTSFTIDDFVESVTGKAVSEIYCSKGYKVSMMTGNYATDYSYGRFSDKLYPDFYKIERSDITVSEIMSFIENWKFDHTTVNMQRFITETPDDVLEELSYRLIDAFDWSGTRFGKHWTDNTSTKKIKAF